MISFALALAAAATQPLLQNKFGLFVGEDYPVEAEQKGVEGTVGFALDVNTDGRATSCRIEKTSGSELLDQTTCRLAMHRALFSPAQDSNGQPTAGSWSSSTTWRLHHTSSPADWAITFRTEGDLTTCFASNGGLQRRVRSDICERIVGSYLKTHAQLPEKVFSSLTAEMLELVTP